MLNSRIVTETSIGSLTSGGDVVNSTVLAGYLQGLSGVITTIENNETELGDLLPDCRHHPHSHRAGRRGRSRRSSLAT